jgi:hypothetical protein
LGDCVQWSSYAAVANEAMNCAKMVEVGYVVGN